MRRGRARVMGHLHDKYTRTIVFLMRSPSLKLSSLRHRHRLPLLDHAQPTDRVVLDARHLHLAPEQVADVIDAVHDHRRPFQT